LNNSSTPTDSAAAYSGSFLERSTLTGDWGGLRNELAAHGLTIDLEGIYTFQGVASGGTRSGDTTGNLFNGDLAITLDTQKAGLWPGGLLKVRLDGRGSDGVVVFRLEDQGTRLN